MPLLLSGRRGRGTGATLFVRVRPWCGHVTSESAMPGTLMGGVGAGESARQKSKVL
jgi:hypothetical protein